jgi:hypothetical protein
MISTAALEKIILRAAVRFPNCVTVLSCSLAKCGMSIVDDIHEM